MNPLTAPPRPAAGGPAPVPRTRAELRALQLDKARALLARLEANPFYGPGLARSGVTAERLFDLAQWRDLPLADKASFLADQAADPPLGRRVGVARSEVREIHLTSGTSGLGQEAAALTAGDVAATARTWRPLVDWFGLAPGDVFATFYPVTVFTYGRSLLAGASAAGLPVLPVAALDRAVALTMMRRLQPAALGARPALFRLLEEALAAEGTTPRAVFPGLRALVCSGVAPEEAARDAEVWGATVHEVYGSSQAGGLVAATGPGGAAPGGDAGVMRCLEELFLLETVDPVTLEPVEEGEAELILTCLDRVASPVVRFRTGDRVDVVPPGASGDAARIGLRAGSVGRWDDMAKIRGNNVWPGQLDAALLGHPLVRDYRACVTRDGRGVDQLRITVRPDGPPPWDGLDEDLRRRVKQTTNVRPSVEFDPDLPEPGLKPQRLVDQRGRQ